MIKGIVFENEKIARQKIVEWKVMGFPKIDVFINKLLAVAIISCDLCNTGTERKRRISCDSGPCMGGAEFFSDGYPVQERPGWNGRYSTDLYQYPAITYSYMVR